MFRLRGNGGLLLLLLLLLCTLGTVMLLWVDKSFLIGSSVTVLSGERSEWFIILLEVLFYSLDLLCC
jgi:hypothetical protein